MNQKDELAGEISIFTFGAVAVTILWLLARNPGYIPAAYPIFYIFILLNFIVNGMLVTAMFTGFLAMVSLVGALVAGPDSRITFLATFVLSGVLLYSAGRYTGIFGRIEAGYFEKIEDIEIKLNEIKNKIAEVKSASESTAARIKNYAQLSAFLGSVCGALDEKNFLPALKKSIENCWGEDVKMEFITKDNTPFPIEPSVPTLIDGSSSIIAPFVIEMPKTDYVIIRSSRHKFTESDIRFFSVMLELSRVAVSNIELYRKTRELSILDGLTGLYLRGYWSERLGEEFALAVGHGVPMSLVMIDIDYFKKINDTYGHSAGDEVLKTISYILKHRLREVDIIGRYGGEEFAVIMPHTKISDAFHTMENIREIISKERFFIKTSRELTGVHLTVSVGLAQTDGSMRDCGALISAADKNLYEAKKTGRNKVYPLPTGV